MPRGGVGRHHRPSGWVDLPHHLVGRARSARSRKQRRAARSWLGLSRSADSSGTGAGTLLMPEPRLFLDADGVLADFDEGARRLLGMSVRDYERRHGRGAFWRKLALASNFYGSLPEMPDARLLFERVKHLKPTILTGLPLGKWAA